MTTSTSNKVSIRLMSGGHSFSAADIDTSLRNAASPVEVVVVTPRTTLVPQELFVKEHAADYLGEVGLRPALGEAVVYSSAKDGMVAVMAISRKCLDALGEAIVAGVTFTTPLLDEPTVECGAMIHLEDDVLYVRVFDSGLRFAEAIHCHNDADILYYVANINAVYNIYNKNARATGDVKRLASVCRGLFKSIEYANN